MSTLAQVLDPTSRSRELRAYAYLQARFSKGAQTVVDCLIPFVTFAIAQHDGDQFDPEKILNFLQTNYRISIPFYTLEGMTGQLQHLGALKYDALGKIHICVKQSEPDLEGDELDLSLNDLTELESALARFAEKFETDTPYASESWSEALISFLGPDEDQEKVKASSVRGVLILDPGFLDRRIIGQFITKCHSDSSLLFGTITKLYYGVLIGDFLANLQTFGDSDAYRNLNVIYDATVLMRLLGTSGNAHQKATTEMHEALQALGCGTYYFEHTYNEVLDNLGAVREAILVGGPMYRETRGALDTGELSPREVMMIPRELDIRLANLGITQREEKYEDTDSSFQISERDFIKEVRTAFGRRQREPWGRDAMSVAMIVRLRGSRRTADISKSGFVFVTHNRPIARVARRFLVKSGFANERNVPPMLTVSQIMTVAWLANDTGAGAGQVTNELAASCYQACLPKDGWDDAFWEALDELKGQDADDVRELLENDLVIASARKIALDESLGHPEFITTLSVRELLINAKQQADNLSDRAHQTGYQKGAQHVTSVVEERVEHRATELAGKAVKFIQIGLVLIAVVGLVFSVLPQSTLSLFGRIVGGITSLAIGVISVLAFVGVQIVSRLFNILELKIIKLIRVVQDHLAPRS